MAIGLEHLLGPSGEQWTGMSPPQQRSQYPQQKKSQAPQSPFGPQQTVQTSMGNFPNLQAYQQQQDAFVQQHLKNQAQYNQGLQSGQSPQRVPVMDAWRQAGENIQSGQYQGNPFQTGNVDAIMGMFNQYGIQAPQGFRDQLLQNLGQQSAPPMYRPQWDYYKDPREMSPGGFIQPGPSQPPQLMGQVLNRWDFDMPAMGQQPQMAYPGVPTRTLEPTDGSYAPVAPQMGYPGGPSNDFIPKFTDPATGLPYGQRPRDLVGDWGFGDYGPEPPRTPDQQRMDDMVRQQAEAAAKAAQYERSLREMQERHPWLEPVRRSNSPTAQVIGWRPRSGAAQARPARTQGTPYRSGKK